jgi:hypothetical protein
MARAAMLSDPPRCSSGRQLVRPLEKIAAPTVGLNDPAKGLQQVEGFGLADQLPFGRGDSRLTLPLIDWKEGSWTSRAFGAFRQSSWQMR